MLFNFINHRPEYMKRDTNQLESTGIKTVQIQQSIKKSHQTPMLPVGRSQGTRM